MNKNIDSSEDELDLLELFRTVRRERKTIIRFIIIFGVIGFFIAVFSAKEYTASTILVPQTSSNKTRGSLGGLAAMAGISLGGGTDDNMSPKLYPKIVQSIPFQKELLKTYLNISYVEKEITYKEYYEKYKKRNVISVIKNYTIGLPGKVLSLFKNTNTNTNITDIGNDSIYRITLKENSLFRQLQKQLILEDNSKEGYIKIAFSMPEALSAAQMTKKVQKLLQEAITNFKTQKIKDEFDFIESRYNDLKKDFEKKQLSLARFRDRNQGLITSRSQSRIERLESEYNLSFSIYSELAKQLETQKIKLKENTPVFTVIEPVSVPVIKSKPKRLFIIILWLFMGGIIGVLKILIKKYYTSFKEKLNYINTES